MTDAAVDGPRVAASLADWLARSTFSDLTADQVTALLVDAVAAWGRSQGWRVYRRAPSVVPLPPPYQERRSCVDIGCARPDGRPVVVEVDRSNRRRTVEKLLAEAAAGRVAIWLRWGSGGFQPPPPPVELVTCQVTARRGVGGGGRLFSYRPANDRPAPEHTGVDLTGGEQIELTLTDDHGSRRSDPDS